jgi:hypothetical protein
MRFRDRFSTPLLNPTEGEMLEREPLLAYSFYLNGRVHALMQVASEIEEALDLGFGSELVHGGLVGRADTLMWLWILGAYEVVRTMCQSPDCFSEQALTRFKSLKKSLAVVRMPAAKMEPQGKNQAVSSDRSPSGWSVERKDLLVNAPDEPDVYARDLIQQFERAMSDLKRSEVIRSHESSYPPRGAGGTRGAA